jgi:hypothetical protein
MLVESGREGMLVFSTDDLSAEVAADTQQGVYVAPSTDTTGASGAWVREFSGAIDVHWFGAIGDGATDDAAAFTALSGENEQYIPAGSGDYTLTTAVTWPDSDCHLQIDVGATFADTTKLKLGNLLKYHDDAQWVLDCTRKTWGADYANTWAIFQFAQRADATANGVKAVALYGQGIATVSGASAWGTNLAGAAEVSGAVAIGAEITALSNAFGTTTTALLLGGKGSAGNTTALQISSGDDVNSFENGIVINNTAGTKSSIASDGTIFSAEDTVCANGIVLDGSTFTGTEYSSGNLLLGTDDGTHTARLQLKGAAGKVGILVRGYGSSPAATAAINYSTLGTSSHSFWINGEESGRALLIAGDANSVNYIRVDAAATTGTPIISARGETNVALGIKPAGTGSVSLLGGNSSAKVSVNSTGLSFFGGTPAAKPTVTGSKGSNAALTSLLTALSNLGLITDSST